MAGNIGLLGQAPPRTPVRGMVLCLTTAQPSNCPKLAVRRVSSGGPFARPRLERLMVLGEA